MKDLKELRLAACRLPVIVLGALCVLFIFCGRYFQPPLIKFILHDDTIDENLTIPTKLQSLLHTPSSQNGKNAKVHVATFLVQSNRFPRNIAQLPNLSKLKWPPEPVAKTPAGVRQSTNGKLSPLPGPFDPIMSQGQRRLSKQLLHIFSKLMFDNGYGDRFVLYGGTLLGSYRHHDLIPWDDDIDVMVDVSIRKRVQTLLKTLGPDYEMSAQEYRDKIFTKTSPKSDASTVDLLISRRTNAYPWGWPYLDIGYYRVNKTHVTEIFPYTDREWSWPNQVFFPLILRPFGQDWYPAPYRTAEFIRSSYGNGSMCMGTSWSHVLEIKKRPVEMNCANLTDRYAFVEHTIVRASADQVVVNQGISGEWVLDEERLIMHDSNGHTRVIHNLIMPILKSEIQS